MLPDVPEAERVLAAIAAAGYEGTELGPPGYLGDTETLSQSPSCACQSTSPRERQSSNG